MKWNDIYLYLNTILRRQWIRQSHSTFTIHTYIQARSLFWCAHKLKVNGKGGDKWVKWMKKKICIIRAIKTENNWSDSNRFKSVRLRICVCAYSLKWLEGRWSACVIWMWVFSIKANRSIKWNSRQNEYKKIVSSKIHKFFPNRSSPFRFQSALRFE